MKCYLNLLSTLSLRLCLSSEFLRRKIEFIRASFKSKVEKLSLKNGVSIEMI